MTSYVENSTSSTSSNYYVEIDTSECCILKEVLLRPKYQNMQDIEIRKKTFETYKWKFIKYDAMRPLLSTERLAALGFFYLGFKDNITCFYCSFTIGNLKSYTNIGNTHLSLSSECEYIRSLVRNPTYPQMVDLRKRVETFINWPLENPTGLVLAACGFFYSGVDDETICFFCSGKNRSWYSCRDPITRHIELFPDCKYYINASYNESEKLLMCNVIEYQILLHEDYLLQKIIRKAKTIFPEQLVIEAVNRQGDKSIVLNELYNEILDLQIRNSVNKQPNVLLCTICMDKERSTVFEPCRHLISCGSCATLIKQCPICRVSIKYTSMIYIS